MFQSCIPSIQTRSKCKKVKKNRNPKRITGNFQFQNCTLNIQKKPKCKKQRKILMVTFQFQDYTQNFQIKNKLKKKWKINSLIFLNYIQKHLRFPNIKKKVYKQANNKPRLRNLWKSKVPLSRKSWSLKWNKERFKVYRVRRVRKQNNWKIKLNSSRAHSTLKNKKWFLKINCSLKSKNK